MRIEWIGAAGVCREQCEHLAVFVKDGKKVRRVTFQPVCMHAWLQMCLARHSVGCGLRVCGILFLVQHASVRDVLWNIALRIGHAFTSLSVTIKSL